MMMMMMMMMMMALTTTLMLIIAFVVKLNMHRSVSSVSVICPVCGVGA